MQRIFTVLVVALVMAAVVVAMSMPAFAAITPTKVNGGGNTPNGNANGVPTVNLNPSGFAPPGQNP
jgi:multisubunit Na+/H+ antiporter MnhC subunit